jgi:CBS domain-containing protein
MSAAVRDVMTTRVVAVREDADYKEIVGALRRWRVSACPVIDGADRVVGLVSETDLLEKQAGPELPAAIAQPTGRSGQAAKAAAVTAAQLMTTPAIAITPAALVTDAARLMRDRQIRQLPVVGHDGELVGIVSRSDILSVFERPDADIWDEIVKAILEQEFALEPDYFDVTVRSGIVTISGLVDRHETAASLLARVRHAEGVVSVRDRLSYPDQD